ncbi:L-methionine gamma-lyase [termite gut metagenome]|uniref:L-methionine gamma-lyase n=1 Tax=termite gut metagenome TaxID=433724 RepID=A0A5J4SQU3_9ZZZZ
MWYFDISRRFYFSPNVIFFLILPDILYLKSNYMSTEDHKHHFDTQRIHAGYHSEEHNNSVHVPIYQTAAFDLQSTERAGRLMRFEELGYTYSRMANPTLSVLEQRAAALDGAVGAIALASGMSAVSYALLNAGEGGRVIAATQIYGGTYDAYKRLYPTLGMQIDLLKNVNDLDEIRSLIKNDTKALFIESISNPVNAIADIQAIADLVHEYGIPLIVDNSIATPYLLTPFKYGADIIVYSATKALSGHGSVIGGLILESDKFNWAAGRHPQFTQKVHAYGGRSALETFPTYPFVARIRSFYLALLGATLSPFDAYLILQGIETLSERVKKQSDTALQIATYLSKHPKVAWVSYPALPGSKYKALTDKYLPKGAGGIFSFELKGKEEDMNKFIESLKLFSYHPNIGDTRSLVINAARITHHELTEDERLAIDIPPGTIRLSIGLEDVSDLIADLEQAMQ